MLRVRLAPTVFSVFAIVACRDDGSAAGDGAPTSDSGDAGSLTGASTGDSGSSGGREDGEGGGESSSSRGDGGGEGEGGESSGTAGTTATSGSTTGSDSSGGSGVGCPEEVQNACGGCQDLPEDRPLGESCGDCNGHVWTCQGSDLVRCAGDDPDSFNFYPDEDGDGFGNVNGARDEYCDMPPAGFARTPGDCDDQEATVNPDAAETCNGVDDDCDSDVDEGPENTLCKDVCCEVELACDGTACVPRCDSGVICGDDFETCCDAGQTCFGNTCVDPGDSCEFTEECGPDEVCASGLDQCVPDIAVPECEFMPPIGMFDPAEGCSWESTGLLNPGRGDVVATPIVINLTDDNGDGLTNTEDTPDIVFPSYDFSTQGCCNNRATLRIVSGQCNGDGTMNTIASLEAISYMTYTIEFSGDGGQAAADLDGDGVPEIISPTVAAKTNSRYDGVVALRRTADDGSAWEVMWFNPDYPADGVHTGGRNSHGGPIVSISDLEGDGIPEVVVGNVVLDGRDGSLIWDGMVTGAGVPGGVPGVGNNGFMGPSSTVADLDLDGVQEVIAGNTIYEFDGAVRTHITYVTSNSNCAGSVPCDGFNAVGDFDGDPDGEVVAVREGEVFVWDHDGTELARVVLPGGNSNNESGPPTVADFDGDGRAEIGTASARFYVVVDLDCIGNPVPAGCAADGVLWSTANDDDSSRVTGSSVFDFEGDGKAEVVYADETTFRIFDGTTGTPLFTKDSYSHTRMEMPVIADVDNDGNTEIVIAENSRGAPAGMEDPGIEVWRDDSDNWVRTRRIWNQHGYYVTHITEDGRIPVPQEANWRNPRLNNFRQNVQPDGLFHAPDAAVPNVTCDYDGMGNVADMSVAVRNDGALQLPAGTPVRIVLIDGATRTTLLDTATTRRLLPGEFEVLLLNVPLPAMPPAPPFVLEATVDPDEAINECVEDNNAQEATCVVPAGGG